MAYPKGLPQIEVLADDPVSPLFTWIVLRMPRTQETHSSAPQGSSPVKAPIAGNSRLKALMIVRLGVPALKRQTCHRKADE